jgi:hypothetical protein
MKTFKSEFRRLFIQTIPIPISIFIFLLIIYRFVKYVTVNQGLVATAFSGVEANMVIFLKLVLKQTNVEAANTFSLWIGTTYFFSLIGAFLSDSYLGRYLTSVIFQFVLIIVSNQYGNKNLIFTQLYSSNATIFIGMLLFPFL